MRSATVDQGAQPYRNSCFNGRFAASAPLANWAVTAGCTANPSVPGLGIPGLQFVRVSGALVLTQSSINLPVVPGQNYRASVWASITAGMTLNVDMSFHDSAGTLLLAAGRGAMSTAAGGTVIVQPGVWTQFGSAAAKAPSNAVFARVRIFADSGPDGTAYATKAQLTPGLTIPDFADGRTPGWRFEGAADNSTSVGYPPR